MHHATRPTTSPQPAARINAHRTRCDTFSFFNLLTSDALLDNVEQLLPAHRERLYPPTETLSMFLAQAMSADRSCQNIVDQAAIQRLAGGTGSAPHQGDNGLGYPELQDTGDGRKGNLGVPSGL